MTEPIVFPDAELVAVDVLRSALADAGDDTLVCNRVPSNRPERFVFCRRLGGTIRNVVTDAPTIGVECWDTSEAAAHDLARLCRAWMTAAAGTVVAGVAVYRCDEVAGLQNLPDPLSYSPRYVFTVSLALRGVTLEEGS